MKFSPQLVLSADLAAMASPTAEVDAFHFSLNLNLKRCFCLTHFVGEVAALFLRSTPTKAQTAKGVNPQDLTRFQNLLGGEPITFCPLCFPLPSFLFLLSLY
jgi:Na+/phosphate symporter